MQDNSAFAHNYEEEMVGKSLDNLNVDVKNTSK
jgi:hypothetical protein